MKYSVCIPNYNYERYLGRTIASIQQQSLADFEVLVSDNASTDGSVELVRSLADPRIKLRINSCNVGFAGNLDRAGRMATGERMIMLSSDDLMRPTALATYDKLYAALGPAGERAVVSSTWDVIDPADAITSVQGPDRRLWTEKDRVPQFDAVAGGPVYAVAGGELLRRCLLLMRSPFNFAATCYPRALYERVEGYGGGRLINPDKWFHWKLLSVTETAYFVDVSLFAYRWHPSNQTALQEATGALKYVVDEYVSTLEIDAELLKSVNLTRDEFIAAFVEHDIARHGLATLARGQRARARRLLDFGKSVYPTQVRSNRRVRLLWFLLALGPVGQQIARKAYDSYLQKNSSSE